MSKAVTLRPRLSVNGQLLGAFVALPSACGILGLLEEHGRSAPFLALRPQEPVVRREGARALRFGHALLGEPGAEIIQFGISFFEFATYHLLVNPSSPVVKAVLKRILERRYYFVLVIDPDQWTTAFRADLNAEGLDRLLEHQRRLIHSMTNTAQYERSVSEFARSPDPPGRMLEWVCRDDENYLDFTQHPVEMNPAH
jgi:hypothetical protein